MRSLAGKYKITDEKFNFFVDAFHLDPKMQVVDRTEMQTSTSEKYVLNFDGKPCYFIKQIPLYADFEEAIQKRSHFLVYLKINGFPVPDLIRSEGKPYAVHKGRKWQLFSYVSGHASRRDELSKHNAIKLLEHLFLLTTQYGSHTISFSQLSPYLFRQIENLASILEDEKRDCMPVLRTFLDSFYNKISIQSISNSISIHLIHGDFSLNNILFNGVTPTCLVDFDNIEENSILRDLAEFILTSYCFKYQTNSTHFSLDFPILSLPSSALECYGKFLEKNNISSRLFDFYLSSVYVELVLLGFVREDFDLSYDNIKKMERSILEENNG